MNIFTINPNNKKTNSDLMQLLFANFDNISIKSKIYTDHIENLEDELSENIDKNEILYFKKLQIKSDLEKEINNLYLNDMTEFLNDGKIVGEKLYESHVIKYTKNYSYLLYYNKALLDALLSNYQKYNKLCDNNFNLIASWLIKDLNPRNDVVFGNVFILKFDAENNYIEMTKKEMIKYVIDTLYIHYYTELGIPGIYVGNKINYKSILNNDDNFKIYPENNLVCCFIDDKQIWTKYDLRINDFIDTNNNNVINLTDKMNMTAIKSLGEIFCWGNIDDYDLKFINDIKNKNN
jgi:hypothetical protein